MASQVCQAFLSVAPLCNTVVKESENVMSPLVMFATQAVRTAEKKTG